MRVVPCTDVLVTEPAASAQLVSVYKWGPANNQELTGITAGLLSLFLQVSLLDVELCSWIQGYQLMGFLGRWMPRNVTI